MDEVVFDSGCSTSSRLRDAFARLFESPPGRFQSTLGQQSGNECVLLSWIRTPLGPMVAGATEKGICLLEFADRPMLENQLRATARLFRGPLLPGSCSHLQLLESELAGYFAGELREFSVPLIYPGTPFQRQVWDVLRSIPYGETWSYQQLAEAVGQPQAVRAVGRANGLNRLAIVIPCHRVIRKDGRLGGYAGGRARKQHILALERAKKAG